MKLLLIITTLYYTSITPTFSGCSSSANRRLGIRTTNVNFAGSEAKIFANIYSDGSWNGWRRLDNPNCDDFQVGELDYFDDFESITGDWEGIALYNCGNDGLMMEDVFYWNGAAQDECILWFSSVYGPFGTHCLFNDATQGDITNPYVVYSDIYIDGDHECGCSGVAFETNGGHGLVWTGIPPGIPDCTKTENGQLPLNAIYPNDHIEPSNHHINNLEQQLGQLSNYLMVAIGVIILLFVLNACLLGGMIKSSSKPVAYGKVKQYDSEA